MSNKIPQIVTPEGRTEWLKCFTPDYKFSDNGEFGCTLNIENAQAQPLMAQLDAFMEKAIADAVEETGKPKAKIKTNPPYIIDEETGDVSFKFKLKALVNARDGDFTQKPIVIDSQKKPITTEVPTWNGSRVRIGFQPITYYTGLVGAGVSLRMKTVQLIEALDATSAPAVSSAAVAGFDVEDGFEYTPPAPHGATSEQSLNKELEEAGEYDDIPF